MTDNVNTTSGFNMTHSVWKMGTETGLVPMGLVTVLPRPLLNVIDFESEKTKKQNKQKKLNGIVPWFLHMAIP